MTPFEFARRRRAWAGQVEIMPAPPAAVIPAGQAKEKSFADLMDDLVNSISSSWTPAEARNRWAEKVDLVRGLVTDLAPSIAKKKNVILDGLKAAWFEKGTQADWIREAQIALMDMKVEVLETWRRRRLVLYVTAGVATAVVAVAGIITITVFSMR
ncbi:MAG: hypothetical protein ABIJ57_01655 [Pseudomonadota bacterium]